MHHPLRYAIPPLIVLLAIVALYVPLRRQARHVTASSVLAAALIVAFIAAFILP